MRARIQTRTHALIQTLSQTHTHTLIQTLS